MKLISKTFVAAIAFSATIALAAPVANAAPIQGTAPFDQAEATAHRVFHLLESSSTPEATFASLSASDRHAFNNYFLPSTRTLSVELTPLDPASSIASDSGAVQQTYKDAGEAQAAVAAAAGCWATYVKGTYVSTLGVALWDNYTEGKWCGNGQKTTSASFSRSWVTVGVIGWRDEGLIDKGAGVAGGQGRIWAQRKMVFGTAGWDMNTQLPCLRLNGSGNGNATKSTICSIY